LRDVLHQLFLGECGGQLVSQDSAREELDLLFAGRFDQLSWRASPEKRRDQDIGVEYEPEPAHVSFLALLERFVCRTAFTSAWICFIERGLPLASDARSAPPEAIAPLAAALHP